MATLTNTIRWTRRGNSEFRNKSTSLIDSATEAFKLPALNALNKSIKYGDISFATHHDLRKLRKEPEQPENIEEISAHHTLMVIRKKYDEMNKTREALQHSIEDMENLRDKFQAEKNRFEDEKGQGNTRVQQLEDALQGIRLQLEESDMERKIMTSMTDRLKADKVVYDLRKYNMQKQLVYLQKQKQIILKENTTKLQEEDKTRKIHQKLLDHLQAEQHERHAHLTSLQTMIAQKVTMGENNDLRRSQMQEIASATLQDKDQKQKNWYKVLLCCRFVEKLLRDKMNREMQKFNTVEVAFKNIKTATGINNTSDLVHKFLNKEHAYGELLGKIADNQRHIAELKAEQEDLRKERRKLETEQDELNSNRIQGKDLNREEKFMHSMSEKASSCKLLGERLIIWIGKGIKKLNSFTQIKEKEENEDLTMDYKQTVNRLKAYLQKLAATAEEVTPVDEKGSVDNKIDLGSNNLRIELEHKEQPVDKQTIKRQADQEDFVNNQRSEILKNNDKFMKELKKKHEDLRKAKVQAEPKKKEVVAEKPKPQPVDADA